MVHTQPIITQWHRSQGAVDLGGQVFDFNVPIGPLTWVQRQYMQALVLHLSHLDGIDAHFYDYDKGEERLQIRWNTPLILDAHPDGNGKTTHVLPIRETCIPIDQGEGDLKISREFTLVHKDK